MNQQKILHNQLFLNDINSFLCAAIMAWASLSLADSVYGYGGAGNGGTPMVDVLCQIIEWFLGNLGTGLATIAVSALGVGAVFGKTSWGLAITVGVGVAVMFGASNVLIETGMISSNVCDQLPGG